MRSVFTTSSGYTITAATIPAIPPAQRRGSAPSGAPGTSPNQPYVTSSRLTYSYTRNWVPRLGATFRQLAPFPLKSPCIPSAFHAFLSSARMPPLSPPLHIITVDTISSGAHALREMMPAIAPAYTSLSAYSPATAPSADVTWKPTRSAAMIAGRTKVRPRILSPPRICITICESVDSRGAGAGASCDCGAPGSEASAALMLAATRLGRGARRGESGCGGCAPAAKLPMWSARLELRTQNMQARSIARKCGECCRRSARNPRAPSPMHNKFGAAAEAICKG